MTCTHELLLLLLGQNLKSIHQTSCPSHLHWLYEPTLRGWFCFRKRSATTTKLPLCVFQGYVNRSSSYSLILWWMFLPPGHVQKNETVLLKQGKKWHFWSSDAGTVLVSWVLKNLSTLVQYHKLVSLTMYSRQIWDSIQFLKMQQEMETLKT